jgi:hypothetical protein
MTNNKIEMNTKSWYARFYTNSTGKDISNFKNLLPFFWTMVFLLLNPFNLYHLLDAINYKEAMNKH